MKLLAPLLGLSAIALASCSQTTPFEAQAWLNSDNHIHTEIADAPMLVTVSSPQPMHVTTRLHNRVGQLTFVDTQYGPSGTQLEKHSYSDRFGNGTPEQVFQDTFTIDPAKFPNSGWQEIRVRSNIMENGRREFTTTRLCADIQNGKPRSDYCGGPATEGRCGSGAWYDDIQYRIVFVDCRDVARALLGTAHKAGDQVRVKMQDGPGIATIDPKFHAGDPGRVIASNIPANTWTTVTIPGGLSRGPHKLHLRAMGGLEAGVYVLPFTAG
jgi:hypothetical protein